VSGQPWFEAERIVVIGCAGSGKSTLAAKLVARLGLTHIRRDLLGPEGSEQQRAAATVAVAEERWVFDGAPYFLESLVYPRARLIVGFTLPRSTVMRRVISRSVRESLKRIPTPPHRDGRWRAWLSRDHPVRWAWATWPERRRELGDLLASGLIRGARVVKLSTPRGVAAWLAQQPDPGWSVPSTLESQQAREQNPDEEERS
jgi:adenylate kinase family enzyme